LEPAVDETLAGEQEQDLVAAVDGAPADAEPEHQLEDQVEGVLLTSDREPAEWIAVMADPRLTQSAVACLQSAAYEMVIKGRSCRRREKLRLPGSEPSPDPEEAERLKRSNCVSPGALQRCGR
jgi:hypothetical protein